MKKTILALIIAALAGFAVLLMYSPPDLKTSLGLKKTKRPNALSDKKLAAEELKCEGCNLIIISLTNTRKDHIGIYGYARPTTPNIDEFFKNSLVFENAFAPASWTLPVSASLYTSLFPYSHGVMDRYDGSKLPDEVFTFTEALKENGYSTAGITGGGDYNRSFNINQGFDYYVDETNYADFNIDVEGPEAKKAAYLGIERLVPIAEKWLKENKDKKFFLLLQGYDTHCPFKPKAPFDKKFDPDYENSKIDYSNCLWTFEQTEPLHNEKGERYWPVKTWFTKEGIKEFRLKDRDVLHMIALYDGEIAQADAELKNFLKNIKDTGIEQNTIIIFMSEHGDLFGEHGRFMRGGPLRGTFYDPVLNFPFIIKHPAIQEPIRITSLAQTVDILPTFAEMLGIKHAEKSAWQGKSLVPAITGEKEVNEYVYAASKYKAKNNIFFSGLSIVESIRDKDWKLIKEEIFDADTNERKSLGFELYRVSDDPKEEKNLYSPENETAKDLENKLKEGLKRFKKQ